jgi:hypothetical protein
VVGTWKPGKNVDLAQFLTALGEKFFISPWSCRILEDMGVMEELTANNEAKFADAGGFVSPSGLSYIGRSPFSSAPGNSMLLSSHRNSIQAILALAPASATEQELPIVTTTSVGWQ